MVSTSRLLVRLPNQKTWCGLETLENKHIPLNTMLEIKDISCKQKHKSWEKSQNLGKIPYSLAKMKYSIS